MWLHGGKSLFYIQIPRRFSRSPWQLHSSCFSSDIFCKKPKLAPLQVFLLRSLFIFGLSFWLCVVYDMVVLQLQERKMIDRFRLCAKGGDGGNGCNSFRKSRHDRRGRPDG